MRGVLQEPRHPAHHVRRGRVHAEERGARLGVRDGDRDRAAEEHTRGDPGAHALAGALPPGHAAAEPGADSGGASPEPKHPEETAGDRAARDRAAALRRRRAQRQYQVIPPDLGPIRDEVEERLKEEFEEKDEVGRKLREEGMGDRMEH